jgi:hypothetical protein
MRARDAGRNDIVTSMEGGDGGGSRERDGWDRQRSREMLKMIFGSSARGSDDRGKFGIQ